MSEQENQLQQIDFDETWAVPPEDLDATWPINFETRERQLPRSEKE